MASVKWSATFPDKSGKKVKHELDYYGGLEDLRHDAIKYLEKLSPNDRTSIRFYRNGKYVGTLFWNTYPMGCYLFRFKHTKNETWIEIVYKNGNSGRIIDL